MKQKQPKRPEVRLKPQAYQPRKSELEADLRVDASFDECVKALLKPVKVRRNS